MTVTDIRKVKRKSGPRRPQAKMSAEHYTLIARIIAAIEEPELRAAMRAHFGKAFAERSDVFDWYRWNSMIERALAKP